MLRSGSPYSIGGHSYEVHIHPAIFEEEMRLSTMHLKCTKLRRMLKPKFRAIIGIMENQMETAIVYWGNAGTIENEMETTMWAI